MLNYIFAALGGFLLLFLAPFSVIPGYTTMGIIFGITGLAMIVLSFKLRVIIWKAILIFTIFFLLSVGLSGLTSPGAGYSDIQSKMAYDGIVTIDDAVTVCRATGLDGWELAAYAQNLTARKFSYTRRYPWDTPARAFERGQGYCQQQALALKQIYDELGIKNKVVYAARVRFTAVGGGYIKERVTGHTWLRVDLDGRELDVCPGNASNIPGITDFQPLTPVVSLNWTMQPVIHIISTIVQVMRVP